jgi:hypothetical protein
MVIKRGQSNAQAGTPMLTLGLHILLYHGLSQPG